MRRARKKQPTGIDAVLYWADGRWMVRVTILTPEGKEVAAVIPDEDFAALPAVAAVVSDAKEKLRESVNRLLSEAASRRE